MTTYNGPRQLREQKDFDRLTTELVRAQPATKKSVIRWREDVPVPLDSIVIVFTPVAGGSLVLPRPETKDDGKTIVVTIAEGSGPLTVECPRPEEAAERKELVQPGAYTFYAIDRVYYVDTAIVGAVPPAAVEFALESDGTSVLGKYDTGTGSVAPIVAGADDTVLARENGTVGFTQVNTGMLATNAVSTVKIQDNAVTYNKFVNLPARAIMGNGNSVTGTPASIISSSQGEVLVNVSDNLVFNKLWTNSLQVTTDTLTDGYVWGGNNGTVTFSRYGIGSPSAIDVISGLLDVATGGITSNELADLNVTTAKIADSNVTTAKIATGAVRRSSSHFGDFGKYLCSVTKSSNQTIDFTAGFVAITWNSELSDREGMHSTSSNTSRITIPEAGLYLISWDIRMTTSNGKIRLRRDGTTQISDDYDTAAGVVDSRTVVRSLPAGYIELLCDATGAIDGTLDGPSCGLTVLSLDL